MCDVSPPLFLSFETDRARNPFSRNGTLRSSRHDHAFSIFSAGRDPWRTSYAGIGILPTVLYIALPMAVGVAVALEFARMSADGMIAVLYSMRLSAWAISFPAASVAIAAAAAGYWISSVFAPAHVGQMHDVIYGDLQFAQSPDARASTMYTFDNGARTLYFRRWRSADVVSGMFIHEFSAEKNEEQIITAAEAEFRRNANGVVLIMSEGSIETIPADGSSIRTANFDEYATPIGMQGSGGLPQRNWRGVFERRSSNSSASGRQAGEDPRQFAEWISEAAKRCGIPLLALVHALLAIGLVLTSPPRAAALRRR